MPRAVEAFSNVKNTSVFQIDEAAVRSYLFNAPLEFQDKGEALPLEIPLPNGKTETFAMRETSNLSPEIAAQHPEIKTYSGNGLTNKQYVVRINLTSMGFHAILLNVKGDAVYFEKYSKGRNDLYVEQ